MIASSASFSSFSKEVHLAVIESVMAKKTQLSATLTLSMLATSYPPVRAI